MKLNFYNPPAGGAIKILRKNEEKQNLWSQRNEGKDKLVLKFKQPLHLRLLLYNQ